MVEKRKFIEESDSEEYPHKYAWSVVKRQIAYAEKNKAGALYDDLVAMVFAFHCIEGYLNFVGDKIAPELWKDERAEFSKTGIDGKIRTVCELCGVDKFDKGKRPYSTFSELKNLRDKIVHPKTQRTRQKKVFSEGKEPPMFPESYLHKLVSHSKALRARDDVKRIVDCIHSAAISRFPNAGLGHSGLEGISSFRSSSMHLES